MIASFHRPTVAHVALDHIRFNIEQVKRHLPEETKTFAVVKANAYGHGAVAVAKHVEESVDGFCVSNLDEALELRLAGISKSILILGVIMPEELLLAKEEQLTITVASLEWLDLLDISQQNLAGLKVHIKVDSGMGRIGFKSLSEVEAAIAQLKTAGAEVEGIFTHFATADEANIDHFQRQCHFFEDLVGGLREKPAIVHASNSATSLWHSETIMTAVRLGLVIYGLNPSGTNLALPYTLKPALSLSSALVHVKKIAVGDSVGYGATYTAPQPEFIGTIPIGYADGWTRDLQGFAVLVAGQRCEIVGRVSMDQITVRLPQAYPIGTPVTLIGQDGDDVITVTDLAQKRQTINYEVLCLLSDRIPRKYE